MIFGVTEIIALKFRIFIQFLAYRMYSFVGSVTAKLHRLGGLNNLFSHNSVD